MLEYDCGGKRRRNKCNVIVNDSNDSDLLNPHNIHQLPNLPNLVAKSRLMKQHQGNNCCAVVKAVKIVFHCDQCSCFLTTTLANPVTRKKSFGL